MRNLMDKTSTSTKKNVFHEHIILLIEGRFLAFLSIGILAAIWFGMIKDILKVQSINEASQWVSQNLLSILGILLFTVFEIIFLWEFWYRFFGRLFITENEIIWKCPFMKMRRLDRTEIKYTGFDFRFSSNSLRSITTMDMIYFSKHPYPQEYIGKSYKLRNSDDFIKFHASKKLCFCLQKWLPEPRNRIFAAAYESFLRQETRRYQKHTKNSRHSKE